jgi:predicted dehydrogenase
MNRLQALAQSDLAQIIGISDVDIQAARQAAARVSASAPQPSVQSIDELLECELDGIVIATPNGFHAEQACAALERRIAVFCQKPLARTAAECEQVIRMARTRDRLLAVDFCYRTLAGVSELASLVRTGALGDVYAVDLIFHNAYGPDKPWFRDVRQTGGGCVMDLGIHLVDLLLWVLNDREVEHVDSRLYRGGKRLPRRAHDLEDYAIAHLDLEGEITARLSCSWWLPAGCDAVIEASFYGTRGAVRLRNVEGSFYDFRVEHCEGTTRRVLSAPPDDWGGRAICQWARQLASDPAFDPCVERLLDVSRVIDAIYGR